MAHAAEPGSGPSPTGPSPGPPSVEQGVGPPGRDAAQPDHDTDQPDKDTDQPDHETPRPRRHTNRPEHDADDLGPVPPPDWSRALVVIAFVAVHVFFWRMAATNPGVGFGDLGLYLEWARSGLEFGEWPVLDGPWVYPALALIPITLAGLASTSDFAVFASAWMAIVTVLNAAAALALARRNILGAAWWIAFLALLGPVAFGRIDAIAAPCAVLGLLVALRWPPLASALVTVGAWIKVAPGILVVPLFAVAKRPWREVVAPAAGVTAVVVGLVALGGGLGNVTSFLTTQDGRGLQLESVAASWWVLDWVTGGLSQAVYNHELFTWEIEGAGVEATVNVLGWLLPITAALLAGLTWFARRSMPGPELLCWAGLALTLTLIVTNKVGSPQFVGWLAAPVAVGLAAWGAHRPPDDGSPDFSEPRAADWLTWPVASTIVLAIAGATQILVPWGYEGLVTGSTPLGVLLVARNVALVVLLAAVVVKLVAAVRGPVAAPHAPVAAPPRAGEQPLPQ